MNTQLIELIPRVLGVARQAARAIAQLYQQNTRQVQIKLDNSPVTEADFTSHQIIEEGLKRINPHWPILSEEGKEISFSERSKWDRFWLVDPLDGTKEYIARTGEFTVNIALIENHTPILGVVVTPILEEAYWAVRGGTAYFQKQEETPQPIQVNTDLREPFKVVVSRHHSEDKPFLKKFLDRLGDYQLVYCGSALKICWVARGLADLYPRLGSTSEWDTAAGQCILEAAGGNLVDLSGNILEYNKHDTVVNPSFCAIGSKKLTDLCCG